MTWASRSFSCSVCLVALAAHADASSQKTRKLNADLALGAVGAVDEFALDASGTFAVYIADERMDGVPELFVSALDGAQAPVRLNGTTGTAASFSIAQDGSYVVFRADGEIGGIEVYSVLPDGSQAPVRLNANLPAGGNVGQFEISSDSSRVVYTADQDADGVTELYCAPIDGLGAPVKLNGALVPNGDVSAFHIAPDSDTVVYLADQVVDGRRDAFAVPIDGSDDAVNLTNLSSGSVSNGVPEHAFRITGDSSHVAYVVAGILYGVRVDGTAAPVRLSGTLLQPADVSLFRLDPVGAWALYVADQDTPDDFELFGVPVDGSSVAVELNAANVGNVQSDADFTPDGAHVLYRAHQGTAMQLWSVAPDGSSASQQLGDFGQVSVGVSSFQASPDGSVVAFVADQDVFQLYELYRAPVDGSVLPLKLSGSMPGGRNVQDGCLFTPDQRVVFRSDKELDERLDLFAAPASGAGVPVKLNGSMAADRDVGAFLVAGTRVAFLADIESDENLGLHSAPGDGGLPPVRVSGSPLHVVGDVESWVMSPNGRFLVYEAEHAPNDARGLGWVDLARPSATRVLDLGVPVWGSFELTPDASRVIFRAELDEPGVPELYSAPADLGQAPVRLNAALMSSDDGVAAFRFAPDSSRVAYLADEVTFNVNEVYSIPPSGVGTKLRLTPLVLGRTVQSHRISSDSSRVVYTADQDVNETYELFSVPLTGGATVKLHAALPSGRDVAGFEISPDGARVVYRADRDADEVLELYSTPIDGSGPVVELSGALAVGGDVVSFDIAPDSSRVVYVADQEEDEEFELYSVAIGGGSPVKLNASLTVGGDVSSASDGVLFAPDSSLVVYRADQSFDGVLEYFRVPADGSAAPVRLNDVLGPGRSASDGAIGPDGATFVFLANRDASSDRELYSVALAGGATHELNLPLPVGGDVVRFAISPDGKRVAFCGDQLQNDSFELFSVPIGGNGPVRRESGAMVHGGDLLSTTSPQFGFVPNGSALVYRADQEQDGVAELFLHHQGKLALQSR